MARLIDILNEWQNNLEFRERYKIDPEKALQDAGFTLDNHDLEKIKSVLKLKQQFDQSEELDKRINK